jgi:hypothetical protein
MPILNAPRAYLRDLRSAAEHAPLEVLLALFLTVTFWVANHTEGGFAFDWWAHGLVTGVLSLPALFGLSLLAAMGRTRMPVRWGASAAVVLGSNAYAWTLFDQKLQAETWRTAALAAAGIFLFALVPRVGPQPGGGEGRMRTWRLWAATSVRIVTVGLYGVALFAALAGAIAAVASLFDLKPDRDLYGDLAAAIFFGLVPCVIAGGIPEIVRRGEEERAALPRWVTLMGRYFYLPVVVIYGGILYAYTVRVLASGELPKNLLSPLVLFAGLFALLGAQLLEPLNHRDDARLTRRVIAWAPALVIPLLPLAFRAVLMRQDQHGWTEFRYLRLAVLVALGVLSILGAVRLFKRRAPLLTAVPAVLAAVLLLSAVGPWSAPAVSRRDQMARLRAALTEAGLLKGGRVADLLPPGMVDALQPHARVVSDSLYDRIHGTVEYLADEHGMKTLDALIPGADRYDSGYELAGAIPMQRGCIRSKLARSRSANLPFNSGVPGVMGGTFYNVSTSGDTTAPGALRVTSEGAALRVRKAGGWEARADLAPIVARLYGASKADDCAPDGLVPVVADADEMSPTTEALWPLRSANGQVVGQLVLTHVAVRDSVSKAGGRSAPYLDDVVGWAVVRE